ncbi:cytochrome P450 [Ktedonobacter sp. SOSP1-85]|uniref:cytochrome P450 n=1 Tax=Ktedonobacter sp. SOSP1-85 TaxID=2778367 RepID=UPI001916239D|nr:cytochrome P450 [Ktedonobacter sp. SOSP1-85]
MTAHKHLGNTIAQIREERHRTPLPPGEVDVLSTLVDTQQKQKHDPQQTVAMTDQQIVDEMVTLLFGGHETTAATLTWIWYALATYPQARRVYEEVDQVLGGPGQEPRLPRAEDLERFPYTSMFINECLRLWPPAPFTNRVVMQETELRGYTLPAGSTCFVCAYSMHHHPTYYPDPDRFDPDRFTPVQKQLRPALAYFPFGAGPHSCIGMSLAMVELLLAVVTIVRTYQIERITEEPVEAKMQPSLRPVAFTMRVKKHVQDQLLVEQ